MDTATAEPAIIAFIGVWALAIITVWYCASILLEMALYRRFGPKEYDYADGLASFTVNLMSSFSELFIRAFVPLAAYLFIYASWRLFDVGFAWWTIPLAFAVHECAYYLGHVIGHRTGLGWAFHQPHHSSEELNLSTASRGFLFGDPVASMLGLTAALIGIHPVVYVGVVTVKNMWGIWNHTQLIGKMGWADRWLATPANHRVHHGRNPQYIDKNYSQVTIVLDRLFGTFEPEVEAPDFGLVEPQITTNPVTIWLSGWRWLGRRIASAPDLKTKLKYLYKPPEWHHESKVEGCAQGRCGPGHGEGFVAAE